MPAGGLPGLHTAVDTVCPCIRVIYRIRERYMNHSASDGRFGLGVFVCYMCCGQRPSAKDMIVGFLGVPTMHGGRGRVQPYVFVSTN